MSELSSMGRSEAIADQQKEIERLQKECAIRFEALQELKAEVERLKKIIHRQHHELKRLSSEPYSSQCEQLRNVIVEMEHYLAEAPRDIFGFGSSCTKDNIEYSWPIRDEWRAKLLKAIRDYDEKEK